MSDENDRTVERARSIIDSAVEQRNRLNDFERGFITDFNEKAMKFPVLLISIKQWPILERIAEKLGC